MTKTIKKIMKKANYNIWLIRYPRFRIDGGYIFGTDVLYSTRHLTSKCNHCTGGRDACQSPNGNVLTRHAEGDAVLIPTALNCHTIVP